MSHIRRSDVRLWLAAVLIGGAFMVPTGYQMTNVNEPADLFRQWVNETLNYQESNDTVIAVWSFIVSTRLLGNVIGVWVAAFAAETFGRRDVLWFTTLPMIVGDTLAVTAIYIHSVSCIMIGRIFSGIADGLNMNCITTYFTEISPPRSRGKIGVFLMLVREFGMFLGVAIPTHYGLGQEDLLPLVFLVSLVMALPTPFWMWCFPRSPRYLFVVKKDPVAAENSIAFFQGDEDNDMRAIVNEYRSGTAKIDTSFPVLQALKEPKLRISFITAFCFGMSFSFSGRFVCMNYSKDILVMAGQSEHDAQTTAAIVQLLFLPALLLNMSVVDRFGRRPILITACFTLVGAQTVVMIGYFLRSTYPDSKNLTIIIVVAIGVWIPALFILISLQFIPTEIFPQKARSTGNATFLSSMFVTGALSTEVFPVLQNLGLGYGMIFMTVPLTIASAILVTLLPETSNRTVEDINKG